ncbi:hypothetical protein BGX34_003200 [Mortierella sp. NVP85]|nr:hypothetical protein BGX34_003200 [Mortierella sp. NVP85]
MSPFGRSVPWHLSALSLKQALELTNLYLENAYRTADHDIALVLCHEAEAALSQAKSANKKIHAPPGDTHYQVLRDGVAAAYIDLGKLLERQGHPDLAHSICKKSEKWGGGALHPGRLAQSFKPSSTVDSTGDTLDSVGGPSAVSQAATPSSSLQKRGHDVVAIDSSIFPTNVRPPTANFELLEPDERLSSTPQLVCCLGLLQAAHLPDVTLDAAAQKWLQIIETDIEEQERLHTMAIEVVRAYKRDEMKDIKIVTEVLYLAPILKKETYQELLREFYTGVDNSGLLNVHQLDGIAQLMQGAGPGYLDADDLVKILKLLSTRLRDTHQQSTHHIHQLTLAVSRVLDAMADTNVMDLDQETLLEPLSLYLKELRSSSDPYLVYQAAYAYQALLCVPDNETPWQAATRRTGKVIKGISGLVSAVKGFDLNKLLEGLGEIEEALDIVRIAKTAYDEVMTLKESGQPFMMCLKEGLSFDRKRDWYSALRGVDVLIRHGELATLKRLACEAPCRLDPAFQWGLCQRLGEIATNPMWDADVRRGAITFLKEIYQSDAVWGRQPNVKQLVINILTHLTTPSTNGTHNV